MPFPAAVGVLYLPVAVWVTVGVGLLIAYRRAASLVVFRLAAVFVGLWALLATTTLLWVLLNGGWSAAVALVRSPLLLFDVRWAPVWAYGAVGAFAVFATAFALNQAVGRGFLRLLAPRPLPWPDRVRVPRVRTSLLVFPALRPQAFSFTLAGVRGGLHRHEIILLSDGLLARLTPEERAAVIAHEVGHLEGLDGRYLTFLRTLARMMRWDPLLAFLAASLTRREEFRADLAAARMTHDPLALARALVKASSLTPAAPRVGAVGFLGAAGRRSRADLVERIRRLIELARSADGLEDDGG